MELINIDGVKFYAFNAEGNYSLPTYYKLEADRCTIAINSGLDHKLNMAYLEEMQNTIHKEGINNAEKLTNLNLLIASMKERSKLSLNYDTLLELASYYCYIDKEIEGYSMDEFKKKQPDKLIQQQKIDLMKYNEEYRFFFLNLASMYIEGGNKSKAKTLMNLAKVNSNKLTNLPTLKT